MMCFGISDLLLALKIETIFNLRLIRCIYHLEKFIEIISILPLLFSTLPKSDISRNLL